MRYLADFNEIYDDDSIWVVAKRTSFTPWTGGDRDVEEAREGDRVELFDYDGTTCLAIVMSCGEQTMECKLDLSTWQTVTQENEQFAQGLVGLYPESARLIGHPESAQLTAS
jgi:hypothetical protein